MVYGSHFIFDGIDSRDYNLIMCSFNDGQDEELSMGLGIEPIQTELRDRRIDHGGKWSEIITFEFSVMHGCSQLGKPFTRKEIREIASWLTSTKDLRWLSVYDEDDTEYFYYCRFTNIQQNKLGGETIGLTFEITCDSPFAYSDIKEVEIYNGTLDSNDTFTCTYDLYTNTDVEIYPNIAIQQSVDIAKDKVLPVTLSFMNENEENNYYMFIEEHEMQKCTYLIDTLNLLPMYSTDLTIDNIFDNPSSIKPVCVFVQTNEEKNNGYTIGFKLFKNNKITISIDPQDWQTSELDYLSGKAIVIKLQYREKYKVGVF